MLKSKQECEAKLRTVDLEFVRRRLRSVGAQYCGERLERNWVFDDADGSLKKRKTLLRVRNNGERGGIVTTKRPVKGGEFKTREETETRVDCTQAAISQFRALGYQVAWIYEKHRQTWLWRQCEVALDRCPEIGCFVEIEGKPGNIRRVCEDIGLDARDHIPDNYLSLWKKHLKASGGPKRHMIFPAAEREALLQSCLPATLVGD